ncbi:MAG: VWA domain-containing protein, partial [Deltaproteobacteria bacterium]
MKTATRDPASRRYGPPWLGLTLLAMIGVSCARADNAPPTAAEQRTAVKADYASPSPEPPPEVTAADEGWGGKGTAVVDAPPPPPADPAPGLAGDDGGFDEDWNAPAEPAAAAAPKPATTTASEMGFLAKKPADGRGIDLNGDAFGGGGAAEGLIRADNLLVDDSKSLDEPEEEEADYEQLDAKLDRAKGEEEKRKSNEESVARAIAKEEKKREAENRRRRPAKDDLGGEALALGTHRVTLEKIPAPDALTYERPDRVLPRMFYFENTYLGGSAAYRERLLRLDAALREGERPYRLAYSAPQPFDPPAASGLEVTAELDAPYLDQPRRVFLQVGLRGSARYGWRRPPLDVVLVIDGPALNQAPDAVADMLVELLARLGPADRLGVVIADGEPRVFTELARLDRARGRLAATLDTLPASAPRAYDPAALGRAMNRAGQILADAATDTAIVPGTETVLVVTTGDDASRVASATRAAHALTLQGAVTSVFALDRTSARGGWWQVANAGHGNYHHLGDATTGELVGWELESLARVVARLVRVNIRLGKTASAIRVLGTRVLDEEEVARVKAREEATDKNLSRSMGITSDRGEDDDGIQTVIPYFYGDDSHVILVELWVDGPGPIADVTVKYKDMVNLGNATARTSVRLDSLPRPETPESELIAKNVAGFELAESLQRASHRVRHGDPAGAARHLAAARRKA